MKHFKIILVGVLSVISIIVCAFTYLNPTRSQDSIQVITLDETKEILKTLPHEQKVVIPEATSEEVHEVSYWNPQHDGPALIKISLSKQVAYFYKGEHLAGVALISSGKKGFETPVGNFKVEQKLKNHRSGNYGSFIEKSSGRIVRSNVNRNTTKVPSGCYYLGSPMHYYLKFAPEIGIHSGFLPGYPGSHGCVRVADAMAECFFENAQVGTPVIIEE